MEKRGVCVQETSHFDICMVNYICTYPKLCYSLNKTQGMLSTATCAGLHMLSTATTFWVSKHFLTAFVHFPLAYKIWGMLVSQATRVYPRLLEFIPGYSSLSPRINPSQRLVITMPTPGIPGT